MAASKRKETASAPDVDDTNGVKRFKHDPDDIRSRFNERIFDQAVWSSRKSSYERSKPYLHGVIPDLMNEDLLKSVRNEIIENIRFKMKETDIYRIHQSGDLANLDGLEDEALDKLPSLLKLRDSLYSEAFRTYISEVSDCGALSGVKTDMAINLYTPGCHLLCHDDVIGSRRLSYILYLTDPDEPWRSSWGGRLQLYETANSNRPPFAGAIVTGPRPNPVKQIKPTWNSLSFFAVQPGQSYHDVEEVWPVPGDKNVNSEKNMKRARLAISGWFHVPQRGELGYIEGLEEEWVRLGNLERTGNRFDMFERPLKDFRNYVADPKIPVVDASVQVEMSAAQETAGPSESSTSHPTGTQAGSEPAQAPTTHGEENTSEDISMQAEETFTPSECEFLLEYIREDYLTPDTSEQLQGLFTDENCLYLQDFLNDEWSIRIREHMSLLPLQAWKWQAARPPHKQKFRYRDQNGAGFKVPGPGNQDTTIFDELVGKLFPSPIFKKWLEYVCQVRLHSNHVVARWFRPGSDYVLGAPYTSKLMQLEVTLILTPTTGWNEDDEENEARDDRMEIEATAGQQSSHAEVNQDSGPESVVEIETATDGARRTTDTREGITGETVAQDDIDQTNVTSHETEGGSEAKIDGSEGANNETVETNPIVNLPASKLLVEDRKIPPGGYEAYMTLDEDEKPDASSTAEASSASADDPAVYKTGDPSGDDGILHSNPPCWNLLSIILRDQGSLRLVKYLSKTAPGPRYDIAAEYKLVPNRDAIEGEVDDLTSEQIEEILADEAAHEEKREKACQEEQKQLEKRPEPFADRDNDEKEQLRHLGLVVPSTLPPLLPPTAYSDQYLDGELDLLSDPISAPEW